MLLKLAPMTHEDGLLPVVGAAVRGGDGFGVMFVICRGDAAVVCFTALGADCW